MSKVKYYPTMFHTNPFTLNMTDLREDSGDKAMELLLNNSKLKEIGVSKMMLNVTEFSVFDKSGNEYFQQDIPNRVELNSKGIDTEFFINITNTINLKEGTYTMFRFYLSNPGNQFIYDDWRKDDISHLEFIDFDINGGLRIDSDGDLRVKMRFDFKPFSLTSYVRSLKNIFNGSRPATGRLVNC